MGTGGGLQPCIPGSGQSAVPFDLIGYRVGRECLWRWFVAVIEKSARCKPPRLREVSLAARMGLHADEKSWKPWMRDEDQQLTTKLKRQHMARPMPTIKAP